MSVYGEEAGDADLVDIVGESNSRYPRDKSGAHVIGYGGRDRYGVVGGREIL